MGATQQHDGLTALCSLHLGARMLTRARMQHAGAAARLRMILAIASPASSRACRLAQIWRSTGPGRYSFRSNTCRRGGAPQRMRYHDRLT